jgi:hypothetical protein
MKTAVRALLLGGSILVAGGCATTEEWREWRAHTSHYASDQHLGFSMRNDAQKSSPKVTRSDVAAAQTQNWWGKAIIVQTSQIFQN